MKITKILIIIAIAIEIAGIMLYILHWDKSVTFISSIGHFYFKNTVLNSFAYLQLFIFPLICILTDKPSKRNSIITINCGAVAVYIFLFFFINGTNASGIFLFLTAGAIFTLTGLSGLITPTKLSKRNSKIIIICGIACGIVAAARYFYVFHVSINGGSLFSTIFLSTAGAILILTGLLGLITSDKLSKRNSIITIACGISAVTIPLYFFIKGDDSPVNILLLAAGATLTLAGLLEPLIPVISKKISNRSSIITIICGISLSTLPLFFFLIYDDDSAVNILLLAVGAIFTLSGLLGLFKKRREF